MNKLIHEIMSIKLLIENKYIEIMSYYFLPFFFYYIIITI